MDDATLRSITAFADRAAIENVLGLYCRAVDRLDVELLKSVYHPDGVDDHGAIRANAHEFADRVVSMLGEACVYTMHTVTHSVIELRGDEAGAESYYLAVHTIAAGKGPIAKFFGAYPTETLTRRIVPSQSTRTFAAWRAGVCWA